LLQDCGEEVEQGLEPVHVLDHPDSLEVQLIDVFRERGTTATRSTRIRGRGLGERTKW
jgi:hypothetical protein